MVTVVLTLQHGDTHSLGVSHHLLSILLTILSAASTCRSVSLVNVVNCDVIETTPRPRQIDNIYYLLTHSHPLLSHFLL